MTDQMAVESTCTCNTCGTPFPNKAEMRAHATAAHGMRFIAARDRPKHRGSYPCPHCDSTFGSLGSAEQHALAKHGRGE